MVSWRLSGSKAAVRKQKSIGKQEGEAEVGRRENRDLGRVRLHRALEGEN